MSYSEDEKLFDQAVDALVDVWCAEDAGEHADEENKLYKLNTIELSKRQGRTVAYVRRAVAQLALEKYAEAC